VESVNTAWNRYTVNSSPWPCGPAFGFNRFTRRTINLAVTWWVLPGGQSFPIAAHLTAGGVSVIAEVSVHGTRGGFLLDTGAAVTELDSKLANSSALKKVGATTKIGAVSCTSSVQPVVFDNARISTVKLPTVTAASSINALTARSNGKIQGLIGADILSTFGSVTIDFPTPNR